MTSSAQLTFSIQIEETRKISHEATTHRDLPGKLLLWIGEKYLIRRQKMIKFNSQAVLHRVFNVRWSPMDHGVIHLPSENVKNRSALTSVLWKKLKKKVDTCPGQSFISSTKRWSADALTSDRSKNSSVHVWFTAIAIYYLLSPYWSFRAFLKVYFLYFPNESGGKKLKLLLIVYKWYSLWWMLPSLWNKFVVGGGVWLKHCRM